MLGIGREGLNLLCDLMNIGQGLNKGNVWCNCKKIYILQRQLFNIFSKKAVNEEKEKNLENAKNLLNWLFLEMVLERSGFSSLFDVSS